MPILGSQGRKTKTVCRAKIANPVRIANPVKIASPERTENPERIESPVKTTLKGIPQMPQ
jgi:hypothetical protein